jgi:hypothetical protein
MSIRVLNPTVTGGETVATRAPRVGDLNGKVLGVLHNGRQGNRVLLDEIVRVLASKYSFKEVVRVTKPRAFNIAPDDIFDTLVRRCDAVITGVGD